MSFILDALKKAESEHQRASGPVLVDVRIAPPRRAMPAWVWVLGGILLANLVVLTWLVMRKPVPPVTTAASVTAVAPVVAPVAVPAAVTATTPAPVILEPPPGALLPPSLQQTVPLRELQAAPFVSNAAAADTTDLPTLQQLKATGVSLPPLLLNLHVYGAESAQRYVLLNGLRLLEGEFTPDGIKVESITEGGVVLEARGHRFLVPAGN